MTKMSLENLLHYECGYSSAIADVLGLVEQCNNYVRQNVSYDIYEKLDERIKKLEKEKLGK